MPAVSVLRRLNVRRCLVAPLIDDQLVVQVNPDPVIAVAVNVYAPAANVKSPDQRAEKSSTRPRPGAAEAVLVVERSILAAPRTVDPARPVPRSTRPR